MTFFVLPNDRPGYFHLVVKVRLPFSAKHWNQRNKADLCESVTPNKYSLIFNM